MRLNWGSDNGCDLFPFLWRVNRCLSSHDGGAGMKGPVTYIFEVTKADVILPRGWFKRIVETGSGRSHEYFLFGPFQTECEAISATGARGQKFKRGRFTDR